MYILVASIVVASLYGSVMWLAVVALLTYTDGPAREVLACGPIVISGIIVALCVIEVFITISRILVDRVVDEVREWRSIIRGML